MSKVSVIVPIYNVERYLPRCMNSILNQTLKDIEIILIDDGSPDNCSQMCDEYAKEDPRIKVVHKKNAGLGYARNSGLDIATGEYVAFVDSDDYVKTNMYETLYRKAKENTADVVYCDFKKSYTDGAVYEFHHPQEYTCFEGEKIDQLLLNFISSSQNIKKDFQYEMSVWHGIYSLPLIQRYNVRFLSEREYLSEDLPFQVLFLKHSYKAIYLSDCFYYYCMNNIGSLTHASYSSDKLRRTLKLVDFLHKETIRLDLSGFHVKRFFISYLRALLYGVVVSKCRVKKKLSYAKELDSSFVWEQIHGFPYSCLNLNSRIICYLQRKRFNLLSLLYAKLVMLIHK